MNEIDLEAIEARAEKASSVTGGLPWCVYGDAVSAIEQSHRDGSIIGGGPVAGTSREEIAEHIAGMDPDTTLALVERVRILEAKVDLAFRAGQMAERGELHVSEDDA